MYDKNNFKTYFKTWSDYKNQHLGLICLQYSPKNGFAHEK
ncbi:hypothetical protein J500_0660 [Acinetobacter sp. 479375]|nr:hypothetical protein J500_0660 [Acinetobacter sp. 479375]